MKAIQVRVLPATNHLPTRAKVFAEGGLKIVRTWQYDTSCRESICHDLALDFINEMKWNVTITGIGQLPNGDYAVTIK